MDLLSMFDISVGISRSIVMSKSVGEIIQFGCKHASWIFLAFHDRALTSPIPFYTPYFRYPRVLPKFSGALWFHCTCWISIASTTSRSFSMSSSSGPHLEPFCSSCQAFKIDRNRFRSSPFEEKRVHQLGTWDEIRARSCALCRLIASAYHGGLPESILARSRCHGGWAQLSPSSPDACITIWLTPWIEDKRIGLSIRLVGNENGDGTLIQDSWIDVNQVRNWIRICQTKHSCKNVPLDMTRGRMLPEEFMVIDVIKKCLVTPGRSCRFLALSYVWGNSVKFKTTSQNVESLRTEGAFDVVVDQLSPTIRDSMNLTRRLGEQFIWVDSLCILQDNAESSQANIQAMDLIYRQATLVILAADDEAPTKGLLGVSTNPRTATQFSSEILPGLQVMARFNHTTAMDQTVYRTRGWT